jgi:hypothetical protein
MVSWTAMVEAMEVEEAVEVEQEDDLEILVTHQERRLVAAVDSQDREALATWVGRMGILGRR